MWILPLRQYSFFILFHHASHWWMPSMQFAQLPLQHHKIETRHILSCWHAVLMEDVAPPGVSQPIQVAAAKSRLEYHKFEANSKNNAHTQTHFHAIASFSRYLEVTNMSLQCWVLLGRQIVRFCRSCKAALAFAAAVASLRRRGRVWARKIWWVRCRKVCRNMTLEHLIQNVQVLTPRWSGDVAIQTSAGTQSCCDTHRGTIQWQVSLQELSALGLSWSFVDHPASGKARWWSDCWATWFVLQWWMVMVLVFCLLRKS